MELYQYKYSIKNVTITAGNNTFNLYNGAINYIFFYHDYFKRKMPIIKINIELDINAIGAIYQYRDSAKLKMDMYENQYDSEGKIVNTTLYIKDTFTIIPARDQNTYITSLDTTTEEAVDQMRNLQLFEAYLIKMDVVNWFSQQINTIFTDVSKPAALQALFQMRNIPGGLVIATPPQDNEKVPYVTLPLGDLVSNITRLNTVYGLYNTYPIVYYDLHNIYCLNKIEPNISLPNATDFGTIKILLINANKPDRQVPGSYNDMKNRIHYINLKDEPIIVDPSNKISSTKFATVTSINSQGEVGKRTIDEDATKLAYVYEQNQMTVDQVTNENLTGHIITISANSVATSFIKPYKEVLFEPDTQYLNLGLTGHVYRIISWNLSINREGTGVNPNYIHTLNMTVYNPNYTKK